MLNLLRQCPWHEVLQHIQSLFSQSGRRMPVLLLQVAVFSHSYRWSLRKPALVHDEK